MACHRRLMVKMPTGLPDTLLQARISAAANTRSYEYGFRSCEARCYLRRRNGWVLPGRNLMVDHHSHAGVKTYDVELWLSMVSRPIRELS